jgi:hypothetical protein
MPTIKLTAEGKVITKDGLASCTCCDFCAGLWGPGYDDFNNTYNMPPVAVITSSEMTRVNKCSWVREELPEDCVFSSCIAYVVFVPATEITVPYWFFYSSEGYEGGKLGDFEDGPAGVYDFGIPGMPEYNRTIT